MPDSFTQKTSQSWFSRLAQSIKSVLIGVLFFLGSFPLLFWNEGRAVQTAKSLTEGAGAVHSVAADRVDAANEGQLVHLSGKAETEETLTDAAFGVSANALVLRRDVEMYQWAEEAKSETDKKLGGGTETVTTYEYEKKWASGRIDSTAFKKPEGHANPAEMQFDASSQMAQRVTLGAFTLTEELVGMIGASDPLPVGEATLSTLPADLAGRVKVDGSRYYLGANPAAAEIGDLRISFHIVKPQIVSVVAVQVGETFEAYQAAAGDSILLLETGTHGADAMFKAAATRNTILGWVLRAVGFFLMFLGLILVFRPLSVLGDVVPFIGSVLGAGLGIFAFFVAAALSLVTIAVAWVVYRPLLGVGLLIVAAGAIYGLVRLAIRRRKAKPAAAA